MIEDKFQRKQIERAKAINTESIYATLAALVEQSDIKEVFMMLHNVACDMGERKKFENQYDKSKKRRTQYSKPKPLLKHLNY